MSAKLPKSFDFAGRGFADIRVARMKIGVKPNADNEVARLENVLISVQWLGRQVSGTLAADLPEGGRIDGALSSGFSAGVAPPASSAANTARCALIRP